MTARVQPGIFSQIRPAENNYQLTVPDGMVKSAASDEVAQIVLDHAGVEDSADENGKMMSAAANAIAPRIPEWRNDWSQDGVGRYAYWLLVIAGLGIFCGCVGKSAQFPLHVWLPDAMEGPTPVTRAGSLGNDGGGGRLFGGPFLSCIYAGSAAGDWRDRRHHAIHCRDDCHRGHRY